MANYVLPEIRAPRMPPTARDNLAKRFFRQAFSSIPNGIVTILFTALIAYGIYQFIRWGIISATWAGDSAAACRNPDGACWAYVIARWKPILAGQYPVAELWRVYAFLAILAGLLLWIMVRRIPLKMIPIVFSFTIFPVLSGFLLLGGAFGLKFVPTNDWGGLLITVVVATFTIIFAPPLGLLLAIGRTSKLVVLKTLCILFVEIMRGVPLLTVMFIAATIFPLLLPPGVNIDLFTRTLIAFFLFNGAMTSEVFRGGLQSIRKEQYEAAATIGLGWPATMVIIVLPQAIRVIIPALVNSMISIIKETSVLLIIGLFDFFSSIHYGVNSTDWIGGPHILISGYVFAALCFMAACYSLSKYSKRFERRA